MKNCQIRHSYGEDDEDADVSEDVAVRITEAAIANGTAPPAPVLEVSAAPDEAVVVIGGKSCKWCGSTSHVRKSHKDCPCNPKNKKKD